MKRFSTFDVIFQKSMFSMYLLLRTL